MTFVEAAQEILKVNSNKPMTAKEIWNGIKKNNLITTKGKTPWATLYTQLLTYSSNSPIEAVILLKRNPKKINIFEIVDKSPMKFSLVNNYLFNKIDEIFEENNYEEISNQPQLLYTICGFDFTKQEQIIAWNKRITLYNNNKIDCIVEEQKDITYFLLDKAKNTVKIGKASESNDPIKRLSQLKTGNPGLEILLAVPFEQHTESSLHEKFDELRADLEFFFYTKKLQNWIKKEIEKQKKILHFYKMQTDLENEEAEIVKMLQED